MSDWKALVDPAEAEHIDQELYEFLSAGGNRRELAGYLQSLNSHSLAWSLGWMQGIREAYIEQRPQPVRPWWKRMTRRKADR